MIADASYCSPGVAGWAAWAKADGQPSWTWHGKLSARWVDSSAVAELAATAMGLARVGEMWPGQRVLVQSDCMRALVLIKQVLGCQENRHPDGLPVWGRHLPQKPSAGEHDLLQGMLRLQAAGQVVTVRHVKGHVRAAYPGSGRQQPAGRHRVNCLCDRLAKREMRELREAVERSTVSVEMRQYAPLEE
jgi:ribonuclease HI